LEIQPADPDSGKQGLKISASRFGSINGIKADANSKPQALCFHCLEAIPKYGNLTAELDGRLEPMCCIGCKAAAEFISQRGLMRFYQHRDRLDKQDFFADVANDFGDSIASVNDTSKWLFLDSPTLASAYVDQRAGGSRELTLLVDGLYCSSCTWLIERALNGISNSLEFQADVDSRRVRILVADPLLTLSSIVNTIAQLGYQPSPCKIGDFSSLQQLAKQQGNNAIKRIVVAGFGMMQVMTYATAGYFANTAELASMNPELERFFLLVSMLLTTVVVFYSGKPFFDNALSDLSNRHLGMDVPISLAIAGAYFPSVYLVLSGTSSHVYFDSAVMFVFFLSVGRYIEMRARHKLSGSGMDVQALLPSSIEVHRSQGSQMVATLITPVDVVSGDQVQLRQGDTIPFDAKIIGGAGQFDESLLTGEALAINKCVGSLVSAGSKLLSGIVVLESIGCWSTSSIVKVQYAIQSAERSSLQEQQQSRLIARYFVLTVLLLTVIVAITWLFIAPERVFEICLAMLIAMCPCAFALASPVGRSAATHALRRKGVLLTNNEALNSILNVTRWCFDITGTLTRGRPSIYKVSLLSTASERQCLEIVACLEKGADHVLSTAFNDIHTALTATDFIQQVGQGVTATVDGDVYRVGKRSWVLESLPNNAQGLDLKTTSSRSELLLADANEVLAIIQLQDETRPSASAFLSTLRSEKISAKSSQKLSHDSHSMSLSLLSGDHLSSVAALAKELAITDFKAGLLPSDKVDQIRHYQAQGEVVAMVGDGINDAPVLAAAELSIAMASGSELALNNADVVLLSGNLNNLASLIAIAKKASMITKQNLLWALIYNAIALPLAATGGLTPWIAALGMSLSSVLVVLNALRINYSEISNSTGF
ncbi:MAG: heavy metal translocating P-type ATPase, partial [Arenicella sp.]|nr:heavy metal translocating P-type ATPase [Arenicella sp.]